MSAETLVTVTLPAKKFLVTEADYGGYKSGYCFVCNTSGWMNAPDGKGIDHKKGCPVGAAMKEADNGPQT